MHILIIPSWYKTASQPVLGSFFEEQARGLMALGHKVCVMFPDMYPVKNIFQSKKDFAYHVIDNGLHTYAFVIQSFLPRARELNYKYLGIASVRVFKDYIKEHGIPDVLHAHSVFHAGIAAYHLAQKYNIPLIITEHLTHYITGGIVHPSEIKIAKEVFENADVSITVSNSFKYELAKSLNIDPAKFTVVNNMVSKHFFENVFANKYRPGQEFIFLTNSFLNERKNHILAFQALKILLSKNYNVKLKLGGYGEYEPTLRKLAEQLGISKQVEFLGPLSRADVKVELDKCHALLLPSTFETFGVVAIESLACGRPVVATNSGGPKDIINSFNGKLVESFEPADFAIAMENIITHYDDYDTKRIAQDCYERFSQEKISRDLVAIYQKVLAIRSNIDQPIAIPKNATAKNILLTFNYEMFLHAQNSGNVNDCLIEPAGIIEAALHELKLKAVFFIDTLYLQKLKELGKVNAVCKADFELIEAQIIELAKEGHYIFPLINFQWLDAHYNPAINAWTFNYSRSHMASSIGEAACTTIVKDSVSLIETILVNKKHHPVNGIRIGNWSTQPFQCLATAYKKAGIVYDFSVLCNSYSHSLNQQFDYTAVVDPYVYKFNDDIAVSKNDGAFTEFPVPVIPTQKAHFSYDVGFTIFDTSKNKAIKKLQQQELENFVSLHHEKKFDDNANHVTGKMANYLSVQNLSEANMALFNNEIQNNNYLQLVTYTKMVKEKNFDIFIEMMKKVQQHFIIEQRLEKMAVTINNTNA